MREARDDCRECRGRGWHIGECHPRETCGVCDGTGKRPKVLTLKTAGDVVAALGSNTLMTNAVIGK